ncbi:MAG: FAD-dependent oxidoreductase, partial [Kiritimatiellae bacterium]|nr:FAD-dependent oxidoreductase [Kiritimatiellia bacterium]
MSRLHIFLLVGAALLGGCAGLWPREPWDVVVYGSSPAALTAAIEAQRHGKRVVVVSPETRIGGLTTGGLGQTDIGNKDAFGGLALQFYRDVADYYKDASHWTREARADYLPDGQCAGSLGADSMWTFEPHAALEILERWERENRLDVRRGEWLDRGAGGVVRDGARIVAIRTLSGGEYAGRMFVDATYEGDLLAAAGVSYVVGREANAVYGETVSGVQRARAVHHQFNKGVSAYVTPGDPTSGLLPFVERDDDAPDGSGDRRVQAYCFRMCLTDDPANRIPFAKPANYRALDSELLLRNLEAIDPETFVREKEKPWLYMPWINSRMPNRKTDTNNRTGFSTDFVGQNWAWPEASYAERRAIFQAHLDYQRGLMWTLATNPRVPAPIREEVARWGTCRDEFGDGPGEGWQSQLYVREGRRMVGDTVATE